MNLTTPLNILMWAAGLVAVGFSAHLLWIIVRTRYPNWFEFGALPAGERGTAAWSVSQESLNDNRAVDASLKRLETAFAEIDRIERKLRRHETVGVVEAALAVAALRRLMRHVDLDQQARVALHHVEEALSRFR